MQKILTINGVKVTDTMIMYAISGSTLYVMLEYLNPLGTSGQLLLVSDYNYANLLSDTGYAEVNRSGGTYIINPNRVKKIASGVITFDNNMTITSTSSDADIRSAVNSSISFDSNPMTTLGDTIYGGTSGVPTRLPANPDSVTKYLSQTSGGAPEWIEMPIAGQLTFMFSVVNSDISTYESMPSLSNYVAGSLGDISTAGVSTTPTLLGSFATNVGFPNVQVIPVGMFHAHFETQKVAGSNNYYCFFRIYKRTSGGTETLLLTSDNSSQFSVNTIIQHELACANTSAILLNATDRIVIKIYGVMLSSTATIHLYYDDTTDARLEMPSATVDATNFVPYTGATNDIDLGTKGISAQRVLSGRGADVTSALEMTLGADGNLFHITGTTNINGIFDTDFIAGSQVVLIFDDVLDVNHNVGGGGSTPILLQGSTRFTTSTNATLSLIYDGTYWYETSRVIP